MIANLFPDGDRDFRGMRWVNIILRTLHLAGVAGIGGGFLFKVPLEEWHLYILLTVSSGLAMMLLSVWSNGIWFIQLRGVATMTKLIILSIALAGGFEPMLLFMVIAISGIIAHAPGKVRYYIVIPDLRVK